MGNAASLRSISISASDAQISTLVTVVSEENGNHDRIVMGSKNDKNLDFLLWEPATAANSKLMKCLGASFCDGGERAKRRGTSQNDTEDRRILMDDIAVGKGWSLFGILCGHGPMGSVICEQVANELVEDLKRILSSTSKCDVSGAMQRAFKDCDEKLKSGWQAQVSGVCVCLALISNIGQVLVANLGDNNALIGSPKSPDANDRRHHHPAAVVLCQLHLPQDPVEKRRIRALGGEIVNATALTARLKELEEENAVVDSTAPPTTTTSTTSTTSTSANPKKKKKQQTDQDVHRVCSPKYDWKGLKVTRSFGDFRVKDCGVTSVPSLSLFTIAPGETKMLLIASKEVFQILPYQEAFNIVSRQKTAEEAAEAVVLAARRKYITASESDEEDNSEKAKYKDMTALVVKLIWK